MYQTIDNCAYMNGIQGKYNRKINNASVRYGRNAINNLQKHQKELHEGPKTAKLPDLSSLSELSFEEQGKVLKEFDKAIKKIGKFTPLHYQCRYMPTTHINKMALMGAAYEKLGKKTSISTEEMSKQFEKETSIANLESIIRYSASTMDVNKDGKIDLSECAAGILIADALDENEKFNARNIDGVITDEGARSLPFFHCDFDVRTSRQVYRAIHSSYNLNEAQNEFLSNENNLI